jgi:hypothetical protein
MDNPTTKKKDLKEKARLELIEYALNVTYLTVVFAAFTEYRRLLLAANDITYTNYWVAAIEGLILGKVIMIGDIVRLGRGLEDKSLIYPSLYKTLLFTVFVACFKLLEHGLKGVLRGEGLAGGLAEIIEKGPFEVMANSLVVLVAFLPFFAVKELARVLGKKTISTLFFHRNPEP